MDTGVSVEQRLEEMYYLLTGSDNLFEGIKQHGRPDQVIIDSKEMPATDTIPNALVPAHRLRENNLPHVFCHILTSSNAATQKKHCPAFTIFLWLSLNHILICVTILPLTDRGASPTQGGMPHLCRHAQ